jgi:hypothetical protein
MVSALQEVWAELGLPLSADRTHLPTYDYAGPTHPSLHLRLPEELIRELIATMGLRNYEAAFTSARDAALAASAAVSTTAVAPEHAVAAAAAAFNAAALSELRAHVHGAAAVAVENAAAEAARPLQQQQVLA